MGRRAGRLTLLDTHVFIWWLAGGGSLSAPAEAAIRHSSRLVSPISFWELAVLVDRGRVALDRDLHRWSRDILAAGLVDVAPMTPSTAISAGLLSDFHGDPADRLIYATARELGAALVSKDRRIGEYARHHGVEVIW